MAHRLKNPIEFSADVYYEAAREHMAALENLYHQQHYTLAIYVSGVAVEAILRAYRYRFDSEFDSRHDLYQLSHDADFGANLSIAELERYVVALVTLASRWNNNHRYRSEAALKSFLKRARLDRGIRGDFLKENARQAVKASTEIVTLGVYRWNH